MKGSDYRMNAKPHFLILCRLVNLNIKEHLDLLLLIDFKYDEILVPAGAASAEFYHTAEG